MSWKTTLFGILSVISAISAPVKALLDSDAATVPDWGLAIPAVMAAIGLIFARDNKVTSEQAGATVAK